MDTDSFRSPTLMSAALHSHWWVLSDPPGSIPNTSWHDHSISCSQPPTIPIPSKLISFCEFDVDNSIENLFDDLPAIPDASSSWDEIYSIPEMVCPLRFPATRQTQVAWGCASPSTKPPDSTNAARQAVQVLSDCHKLRSAEAQIPSARPERSNYVAIVPRSLVGSSSRGRPGRGVHYRKCPQTHMKSNLALCTQRTQMTPKFDKEEHILRERWRRDDMAEKYLRLQSFLPPSSSKRDRNTTIEEAIQLVKSLQHRKELLLRRRLQLLAVVPTKQSCQAQRRAGWCGKQLSCDGMKRCETDGLVPTLSFSLKSNDGNCVGVATEKLNASTDLKKCVKSLRIHSHQLVTSERLAIELISQAIPNFQSIIFQMLEDLGMEVISSSIFRTAKQLLICNIDAEPHLASSGIRKQSMEDIILFLKFALEPRLEAHPSSSAIP